MNHPILGSTKTHRARVACYALTVLFAGPLARAADPARGTDKIGSAILAHRQQKLRPPGMTAAQHGARLGSLGLRAADLGTEEVALYVDERLDAREIILLRQQGIDINASGWVPAVVGKHARGFHLAVVRYDSLERIRQDERFIFAQSVEAVMLPQNSVARAMINADDVSNGAGVTARSGASVKIAIADSGFDLSHSDFPTPIEAFDMTDGTDPSTWGTDVSNTVTGHGTHVTGSALGRGILGPYPGAAAGATLYSYKIGDDVNAGASDTDMIEAINRFVAISGSGPRIFSMSYGGFSSPHLDGSGAVCQAIDNATAAGVTCFIAAGNEGNNNGQYPWATDRHDSMTVAPGATSGVFSILVDNSAGTSAYAGVEDLRIIWRDGVNDDNVVLSCTNCGGGELSYQWSGTSTRSTEARQYWLDLSGNPLAAGQTRTYNFQLQNTAGSGATPLVHAYRYGGIARFTTPDPTYTIQYPGVADTAITVGAWVQSNGWTDANSAFWQYTWMFTNALAPFSSVGPRIDGALKPDIVAPGSVTVSTRDSGSFGSPVECDIFSGFPLNCLTIDNDGFNGGPADYYVEFGTSMATPMAAGAAALMLEAAPTMTPAQVKNALAATASSAGSPDSNVGSGLIDILAAIQSVDCDDNGVYDVTEINDGSAADCDMNSLPDACDIAAGTLFDCNGNATADLCDIGSGASEDCNTNNVPDECDLTVGLLTFGSEINSGIGTNFIGTMATGYFDNDQNIDVAYRAGATLSVLLGNGNATFSLAQYPDGGAPGLARGVDVDGDGDDDLIGLSGEVHISLSNGDGTFAPHTTYGVAGSDVTVADFDRDGVLDLAIVEGVISMYPGNGDGTFGAGTQIYSGSAPSTLTSGDVDSDGYEDVVAVISFTNEAVVLVNNGDGSFAVPDVIAVGTNPQDVTLADLDADGHLDIAMANYADLSDDDLSVLFNNGDGTFAAVEHFGVAAKSLRVLADDFDRDGLPDIAIGHYNDFSRIVYSVMLSHGDGTFATPVHIDPLTQFIAGSGFGDFNNDGAPEWVFHQAFQASVLPNTTTLPTERDCNANGSPDSCDISSGNSSDCQSDGIPDDCQLAGNECNANGVPSDCEVDGDDNGVPDACEGAGCTVTADCADLDGDDIRDNNCTWWTCDAGSCVGTDIVFADMGGQFGSCPTDGTADGNDRFHALNCFADTDPNGPGGYGCEAAPPAAFNVDAGGQFGSCAPDSVCDGNDAFAALNAFAGTTACSCPLDGGPAPMMDGPQIVDIAELVLTSASDAIAPRDYVEVHVTLDTPLDDLRGYQLHVASMGGSSGQLELIDIGIYDAPKRESKSAIRPNKAIHAFDDVAFWDAYNVQTSQMVAGLDTAGIMTDRGAYLATFTFRASANATGTFMIDLQYDDSDPAQRTFLFATPADGKIAIRGTVPAVVSVVRNKR